MKIIVTGAAGFIGMAVCSRLLDAGAMVVGIDNLNDYYDVHLKRARLARLEQHPAFSHVALDIADTTAVAEVFGKTAPERVLHLAAQAGVRYSLVNPQAYAASNLAGFVNILDACRHGDVAHLVYASSSSVYGGNRRLPYRECDAVDHPLSLYAASKRANELMAHSYSHLFALPTTALRFFTVYGPWGRPDMAPMLFARAMCEGRMIEVFNQGQMLRDFTYIDDVVEATLRVLDQPPARNEPAVPVCDPSASWAPWRVLNVGNAQPVMLMDFLALLERSLGRTARVKFLPMQAGDVGATHADTTALRALTGYAPATPLSEGVDRFARWYRDFYSL